MNEGINGNNTQDNNVENAFSDLVAEYFEGETITENAGTVQQGYTDNVTNTGYGENTQYENIEVNCGNVDTETGSTGTTTGNSTLYENLVGTIGSDTTTPVTPNGDNTYGYVETVSDCGTTNTSEGSITENNETIYGTNSEVPGTEYGNNVGVNSTTTTDKVYKTFETTNSNENVQTIAKNAYGVVTINGNLSSEGVNGTVDSINTVDTTGTDFKLTQGNLPAKISFWTKVRNFFISDSKMQYSVQEPSNSNGGVWNKLQNLFSFGKNK